MSFKTICLSILPDLLLLLLLAAATTVAAEETQWQPTMLEFTASGSPAWYTFPLKVTFTHLESSAKITLDGYWDGGKSWKVRFAPTQAGEWNWISSSSDSGLNAKSGSIAVSAPSAEQADNNPNLRGHLKISGDRRRLEYRDGTPFFWMGDTNWHINDDRCGIKNKNFYKYVDNRKAKKFNLIQMQYFSRSHYNEGGYPIPGNIGDIPGSGNWNSINPAYFQSVDQRMDYLFDQGFVVAGHPRWICQDSITQTWAQRILRYLLARYGAYNTVWSLTGEYQFSRDHSHSLTPPAGWNQLGNYVQTINPYKHPVTIHPTYGAPSYVAADSFKDYSSSGEFHNSSWLDINWIQTYAWIEDLSEAIYADYAKKPVKPVIMAEPGYEFYRATSYDEQIYGQINGMLARLQAWSAILCGAAGHTYGAWGVWQFYDPSHEQSGSDRKNIPTWSDALDAEGAADMSHLITFFTNSVSDWIGLVPHRDWLRVNGKIPSWPTKNDFSPPHLAADAGNTYVTYVPAKNSGKAITVTKLDSAVSYRARWYDPRNGAFTGIAKGPEKVSQWNLPARPSDDDWVLLLTTRKESIIAAPTNLRVGQ